MFTSENKYNYYRENGNNEELLRSSLIYLIVSIVIALAGAVYEHFSFGVYSYFMIYAFLIPLAGGALPYMIRYLRSLRTGEKIPAEDAEYEESSECTALTVQSNQGSSEWLWHAGITTLTVGSIVHGILAICGRPNRLTIVYLVAGIILLAASAGKAVISRKRMNRGTISAEFSESSAR